MADASASAARLRAKAADADVRSPIRVMVVDDSRLMCWLLSRWIGEAPGLKLVGTAASGREAVATVARRRPDIVLLDLELPDTGRLKILSELRNTFPSVKVIVIATLTRENAGIALEALARGAADCVGKPDVSDQGSASQRFRRALLKRIEAICRPPEPQTPRLPPRGSPPSGGGRLAVSNGAAPSALRSRYSLVVPRVIGVGSSTGGPEALLKFLPPLAPVIRRLPVLIAQHMSSEFTASLAVRLAAASRMPAKEGEDGEPVRAGQIYLAPGNRHMTVAPSTQPNPPTIAISDDPPVSYYRPSVDLMFRSLVAVYGPAVLGVVLTGMGSDGAAGAGLIANAGGSVLAQDRESSVVWGMPGAVSSAGYAAGEGSPELLAQMAAGIIERERVR